MERPTRASQNFSAPRGGSEGVSRNQNPLRNRSSPFLSSNATALQDPSRDHHRSFPNDSTVHALTQTPALKMKVVTSAIASLSSLLVLGILLLETSLSFQPTIHPQRRAVTSLASSTKEETETVTYFDDLVDAVRASTTFGLYDSDELHALADKVEAGASTCIFEVEGTDAEDGFLCQKEIDDRMDVAEVLRMQAELQLRMEAIRGSSLFAADCLAEDAIRQRDELMDYLGEDSL